MTGEPHHDEASGRSAGRDRAVVSASSRDARHDEHRAADGPARGEPRRERSNWAATAALICGVGGLIMLFLFPPLGLLLALIAVIAGIVGLVKARHPYTGGTGQALTGLVTGIITFVFTALVIWGITALLQNSDFQERLQDEIEQVQGEVGG